MTTTKLPIDTMEELKKRLHSIALYVEAINIMWQHNGLRFHMHL